MTRRIEFRMSVCAPVCHVFLSILRILVLQMGQIGPLPPKNYKVLQLTYTKITPQNLNLLDIVIYCLTIFENWTWHDLINILEFVKAISSGTSCFKTSKSFSHI